MGMACKWFLEWLSRRCRGFSNRRGERYVWPRGFEFQDSGRGLNQTEEMKSNSGLVVVVLVFLSNDIWTKKNEHSLQLSLLFKFLNIVIHFYDGRSYTRNENPQTSLSSPSAGHKMGNFIPFFIFLFFSFLEKVILFLWLIMLWFFCFPQRLLTFDSCVVRKGHTSLIYLESQCIRQK